MGAEPYSIRDKGTCNNILAMTQVTGSLILLLVNICLSVGKRSARTTNGASNAAAKKGSGAGGMQSQLVNRALEGLSRGGRSGMRGRAKGHDTRTSARQIELFKLMHWTSQNGWINQEARLLMKNVRIAKATSAKVVKP
ncbi:hypothetical protein AAG906_028516 [Vitis piasezkii]